MTTRTPFRGSLLTIGAAVAAAALALAGCSSSPSTEAIPKEQSIDIVETTDEDEVVEEEVVEEEPAALSGDACLVGKWRFDNESFREAFEEYAQQEGGTVRVASLSGSADADFRADGTVTTTYDDWKLVMESEGIEVTVHRDGADEANWSTNGNQLELQDTKADSLVTVEAAGMPIDASGMELGVVGGSFECNGNTLLMTDEEGGTTKATRTN